MKAYSNQKPPAYFFHTQPRNPSITLVRFCDNPTETESGWQYDEYHLEMADRPDLKEYVQNHYNELLQEAKGGPSEMERLRADLDYVLLMGGF